MGITRVSQIAQSARRSVGLLMMSISALTAQTSDGSFSSPVRFGQQDGEVIYRTVCQGCHMPSAEGAIGAGTYPPLAHDPALAEAGYAANVVVNGSRAMPPFGRLLDDNQIAAVLNYVRSHFGNAYTHTLTSSDVKSIR